MNCTKSIVLGILNALFSLFKPHLTHKHVTVPLSGGKHKAETDYFKTLQNVAVLNGTFHLRAKSRNGRCNKHIFFIAKLLN